MFFVILGRFLSTVCFLQCVCWYHLICCIPSLQGHTAPSPAVTPGVCPLTRSTTHLAQSGQGPVDSGTSDYIPPHLLPLQALDKIWMILAILGSSVEDRPARRSYAALLLQLNLIFSPLLLLLILVSSVLSSPMLPLFTLPVFFVSFPRPSRLVDCSGGHHPNIPPGSGLAR